MNVWEHGSLGPQTFPPSPHHWGTLYRGTIPQIFHLSFYARVPRGGYCPQQHANIIWVMGDHETVGPTTQDTDGHGGWMGIGLGGFFPSCYVAAISSGNLPGRGRQANTNTKPTGNAWPGRISAPAPRLYSTNIIYGPTSPEQLPTRVVLPLRCPKPASGRHTGAK